ncbi:YcaO-like family protein [Microbispora sp. H10670]|uniref:YcaO-like family protein n=1 Tax=Microbispora sp. H10670 TaxID=2729108 RepID=UPI001600ABB3|nr:YcaO-like family protein [Microbispora sp. H10670]
MRTETSSHSWLLSGSDQSKVRLPGTDRARDPAATLEMAGRAARRAGVTRVADITRLDTLGIPTYQAIRPTARTLAVSQGKGVTADLAKLSAMMEAVELWHAEQPMRPVTTASPRDLAGELGYDVGALPRCAPSLLHDGLPVDWVAARSLADGSPTLVPMELAQFTLVRRTSWNPPVFFSSTNGLASGNTLTEGVLHALYEVIERDAVTAFMTGGDRGTRVDPRSLGSPVVDDLCVTMERARVRMEVRSLASPTGLPCFLARITCDDYPPPFLGFGCHLGSEIALSRAVTEAAQARLGYIAGSRDDLHANVHDDRGAPRRPEPAPEPGAPITPLHAHESLVDDLDDVVKRATVAFSHAPLVVDLTREDLGVPVVRVLAPGSRVCPEVF